MTADSDITRAAEMFLSASQASKLEHIWLERLHCPWLNWQGHLKFDCEPSDTDRTGLKAWLPRLIACMGDENLYSASTTSLLVGISVYVGADYFPETENEAYALAFAILYYISDFMPNHVLDDFAKPHVCAVINAWLKPDEPWVGLPDALAVCRHLFGHAWCVIVLPGHFGTGSGLRAEIEAFVRTHRPPLLPGLCRAQASGMAVSLPECIGAAQ